MNEFRELNKTELENVNGGTGLEIYILGKVFTGAAAFGIVGIAAVAVVGVAALAFYVASR